MVAVGVESTAPLRIEFSSQGRPQAVCCVLGGRGVIAKSSICQRRGRRQMFWWLLLGIAAAACFITSVNLTHPDCSLLLEQSVAVVRSQLLGAENSHCSWGHGVGGGGSEAGPPFSSLWNFSTGQSISKPCVSHTSPLCLPSSVGCQCLHHGSVGLLRFAPAHPFLCFML